MEGFDRGEARRSNGEAWMVQLVCCVVASTADGVIPAMRLDGGARTPARLHGWRTAYGCGRSGDELHDGEMCTARAGARWRPTRRGGEAGARPVGRHGLSGRGAGGLGASAGPGSRESEGHDVLGERCEGRERGMDGERETGWEKHREGGDAVQEEPGAARPAPRVRELGLNGLARLVFFFFFLFFLFPFLILKYIFK
jgi:hypothetical protein